LERHNVVLTRAIRDWRLVGPERDDKLRIARDPDFTFSADHLDHRRGPNYLPTHDNTMEHAVELHMDI
jgi:hypothetical protein